MSGWELWNIPVNNEKLLNILKRGVQGWAHDLRLPSQSESQDFCSKCWDMDLLFLNDIEQGSLQPQELLSAIRTVGTMERVIQHWGSRTEKKIDYGYSGWFPLALPNFSIEKKFRFWDYMKHTIVSLIYHKQARSFLQRLLSNLLWWATFKRKIFGIL